MRVDVQEEGNKIRKKKCYYYNDNNNGCSWWLEVMVLQAL